MPKNVARIFALTISVAGYALLWTLDWRAAIGVCFVAIANVIFRDIQKSA